MRVVRLICAIGVAASPVFAQAPTPAVAATAVATTKDVVVPEGTEFSVATVDEVTSKIANKDDVVSMKVDEPVVVGTQVVIPKGAFVRASVADVKRAGHFGHAGTLSVKIESTSAVDGQKIPLRASKAAAGDSHMGATVALTVLFGPLGLLKHGNDVKYLAGTKVTVFTDQQMTIKVPQG
jgi:hypothetical protein